MGFVGGGGNIAIRTALPSSFVYCIVNIKWFIYFLYLTFYARLRLRFMDVETNQGPRRPVPDVCRILCSNVRALAGNLSCLTVARLSMIYCCVLRFWSQICVMCRSCWFPDSVALSCCARVKCPRPERWLHTYEMVTEQFANPNLSMVVEKCTCFLWCVVCDRTFVFSLYRNPDLDVLIVY